MRTLAGSALILGGGALLWMCLLRERRRRREMLWDLITALRRMGEEIRMARTPLPALLSRAAETCGAEAAALFRSGAAALGRGEQWMIETKGLGLSPRAQRLVRDLAAELRGDEEKVCKAINLAIIELQKEWDGMERGRQAAERQLTAVCFSASALLVILLI